MSSLADALEIFSRLWPEGTTFRASDAARLMGWVLVINKTKPNDGPTITSDERKVLREVFVADLPADICPSSKTMGRRLRRNSDAPTMKDGRTFTLRGYRNPITKDLEWYVIVKDPPETPKTRKKPGCNTL